MIVDLDRAVRRLDADGTWSDPEPLSTYRYAPAYVLLGDPGAGKSTAFDREQHETPGAELVTARDLRTIYGPGLPTGVETLFVDGLDEARAGGGDPRRPFDQIRSRLRQLSPKRVRCSCRELDWLGENDRTNLSKVVPGGEVIVLRLEPLNADEQCRIIGADPRSADPAAFLIEAAERGVDSLLTNAQTLSLVVRVVAENGAFPDGRAEIFEEACRLLAREPNDEHRIAAPLPEPETLVETAGYMCAVSLLSGSVGFSLPNAWESDRFVPTSRFGAGARSAERAAHTRLFAGIGGGRFVPVHANIAAFLAAQHLARLVHGPVPGGRILALLTGTDGLPPTPLRSLVAWLAVTSRVLRKTLIERDPVAVLMYGDVREFTPNEKTLILDQIGRNPDRLYEGWWSASAVAGLATQDMEPSLRRVLGDPDRTESKQKVVEIVTIALGQIPANEALTDILLAVWLDETRWFRVRKPALDAWIHNLADEPTRNDRLRKVLGEIRDGGIEDYWGEKIGTLLRELYPRGIGPTELWEYFSLPSEPLMGRFYRFWAELPDACPDDHLPDHLDYLAESRKARGTDRDLPRPVGLPVRFLARGIEIHGEQVGTARLTAWLRVGLDEWGMLHPAGIGAEEACRRIREWLEAHAETQKAVIRFALGTPEFRELESVEYHLNELLYRSSLPDDIGSWHLDQAVIAEESDVAAHHVRGFLRTMEVQPVAVAVEDALREARRQLASRSEALAVLEAGLKSRLSDEHIRKQIKWQHVKARKPTPESQLLEAVRSHEDALRENRAPSELLHTMAYWYYEDLFGPQDRALSNRLVNALGGDEQLTAAAMRGVLMAPHRNDLPSATEVLALKRGGQISYLTVPVLAALRQMDARDVLLLGERKLRTALAFRLVFGPSQKTDWYLACVSEHPNLVAETLVLFGRTFLRAGETVIPDFHSLANDADHHEIARRTTLPLLRAFPVRAKSEQMRLLDELLWSGLNLSDRGSFGKALEAKLASKSMTTSQRTRWLAAGVAFVPRTFLPRLEQHIAGSEQQVRGLTKFFSPSFRDALPTNNLDSKAVEFLIRVIGGRFEPADPDGLVTIREEASDRVRQLVNQLAVSTDLEAGVALDRLVCRDDLAKWRSALAYARGAQRIVRRDANYAAPAPAHVIAALDDGPPANASDLRELVLERLSRVAEEIRTTNVNLWEQFWNEDPEKPRHENACRNALLAMLLPRLPHGCDAQPEGQYAADRRADIRVTSGGWNIPVEIKKNSHAALWRAVRDQLLPRYSNDPATQGLGVYLVLWFGTRYTAPAAQGLRPPSPDNLRVRLLASLTTEERRRAAVIVMDVTPPRPGPRNSQPRHSPGPQRSKHVGDERFTDTQNQ